MKRLLPGLLVLLSFTIKAQTTFIINGPADKRSDFTAYTHATVYINPTTVVYDATIIVSKGKVESVTAKGSVPPNAMEINLTGKVIYPSFTDLYSDFGITLPTPQAKSNHSGEQFNSTKAGAYAWNEALKPEINAAELFSYQESSASFLRTCGFANVLTGNHDGICRGTTAWVSTAQQTEHFGLLASNVSTGMSFNKGRSKQPNPSSLMGSIALIRQTYYDAKWYITQQAEKNISLEAFTGTMGLPVIFDAGDKQNVLRAATIAKEFNMRFIIKTSGHDYQRLAEIKQTAYPLIVPVNFPKTYKINDINDAELISTADLKHWELAPSNLYWLWKNNISFCITSNGCTKPDEFLNNLRKAVKYGIPKEEVLKALTTTPAKLINQQNKTGQLGPGYDANFIICNADIFQDKSCILKHVIMGKIHDVNAESSPILAESYEIKAAKKIVLNVKKGNAIIGNDTFKLTNNQANGVITFTLDGTSLISYTASAINIDSSVLPFYITTLKGFARSHDANAELWVAESGAIQKDKNKADSIKIILSDTLIWFPFTDYGNMRLPSSSKTVFRNGTVWSNEKDGILSGTDVIIDNGKIISVGKNLPCTGCSIVDATGKHLTNGIIDEHSHIAITHGVNEGTQAVTSEVRIGDVINADDINIYRQLAGGVTTSQLLHGSANPVGGQSAIIKLRWGLAPEKMKVENSPMFIKFALGENVKQANWGDHSTTRYPQTRMGVEQVFIDAFTRAEAYKQKIKQDKNTRRDLELEALGEILDGRRHITCHSYVQSEINMLMHVADSFHFKVNTFTHILEGYKVADKMKKHGVHASTFADWWAYKYEVIDAIPYNAALMHKAGITVAINSDDAEMGRRLNQEAAKTMKYGNVSEEDAWKMVTLNPAKMLHLDHRTGSIKPGKDADLVLWNDHPLSIYAKPEMTYVDGICYYSLDQDLKLRQQIEKDRARLISSLLQAQKTNSDTQSFISIPDPNYHCND